MGNRNAYFREYMRQYRAKKKAAAASPGQAEQVTFASRYGGAIYKLPDRRAVRFEGGVFTTADAEIIAYLRSHPDYGATLTELLPTGQAPAKTDRGPPANGRIPLECRREEPV